MPNNDMVSKAEVFEIINQYYLIVANSMDDSRVSHAICAELAGFCNGISDAIMKLQGKPFELNYPEDYYIRHTIPTDEVIGNRIARRKERT